MTFLDSLLDKKLILVTGKGGIGKSLTSASIAQYAASKGKKVCLVESNSQEQLSALFGNKSVGHNLTEIQSNLFLINLNPQENFKDFVVLHLGFAKLFDKVFTKPLVKSFINMIPGIAELTLLGRLTYFCKYDMKNNFDLVVFDGFASGHFLSLMKTPDAVINSGMVGPIIKETQDVRDFIFDKNLSSTVLVAMPESLVINEAIEFSEKFQIEFDIPYSHLLLNRCFLLSEQEKIRLENLDSTKPAIQYLQSRIENELVSLNRLSNSLINLNQMGHSKINLVKLADLGAIQEPINLDFASLWFSRAEGISF